MLTVQNLVAIISNSYPVHHIQRKAFQHRLDNGLRLLIIIDKFPLIGRANGEPAAVGKNAVVAVVGVTVKHFPDLDLFRLYFHGLPSF